MLYAGYPPGPPAGGYPPTPYPPGPAAPYPPPYDANMAAQPPPQPGYGQPQAPCKFNCITVQKNIYIYTRAFKLEITLLFFPHCREFCTD